MLDFIHMQAAVRTNIDLDEALVNEAMAVTGLRSKKAVVDEALRRLVRAAGQAQAIRNMSGLGWDGDLDAIRGDEMRGAKPE